jgi:hypothetical protein
MQKLFFGIDYLVIESVRLLDNNLVLKKTPATTNMTEIIKRVRLIGRSTKVAQSPCDIAKERLKYSSNMAPIIKPMANGVVSQSNFLKMYPIIPNIKSKPTSNQLLFT